jgi:hypothetical protein
LRPANANAVLSANPSAAFAGLSEHIAGIAGGNDSGMGTGGGGMGGGRHTSADDSDDNYQGSMHEGAGLGLIKWAFEDLVSFEDSITVDIDVKKYVQQQASAWTQQHEGGATILVMDASALVFRGGGGGSASDAVRQFLERTFSGLKDVIVVVSRGQASVPDLMLHVQVDNCTVVALLHAAVPKLRFACCMLQHPSCSFLAACCSTRAHLPCFDILL